MELEIAQNCVKDEGFVCEHRKISFINRLFPQVDSSPQILICYIAPEDVTERITPPKKENESQNLDITGSPLHHSFGDDSFQVSIASVKQYWMRSEERYVPLDLKVACEMLSFVQERLSDAGVWTTPLFALANPEENEEKAILLGAIPDPKGFITLRGSVGGVMPLSSIQETIRKEGPLLEHNADELNPNDRVRPTIEVSSVYEVCGVEPEITEFCSNKEELEGHLRIEIKWGELTFIPSVKRSTSLLIASIVTGARDSPFQSLWGQLLLLNDFLGMLEDYEKRHMASRYSVAPLNFPANFVNSFAVPQREIMKKLSELLTGLDGFDEMDDMDMIPGDDATCDDGYRIKLEDLLGLVEKRQDPDFVSALWKILKSVDSYKVMTDCIHEVFEEASNGAFKPMGNTGEETRLIKLLELEAAKNLPQLAGSVCMEFVVDLGLEKLIRDYSFLVDTGNLMEARDFRKMFNNNFDGNFDLNKCRENLMTLAHTHIVLEFIQMIQTQLNCRMEASRPLFESALKIYRAPDSPFKHEDLKSHVICNFRAPAPKDIIYEVIKTSPALWRCALTTQSREQSYTTVTHYSRTPIFPPNIYLTDDLQLEEQEDLYYVTTGNVIHFKLP